MRKKSSLITDNAFYFPEEIVYEILSWLDEKSLLRCTSVSKIWYAVSKNKYFVEMHAIRNLPPSIDEDDEDYETLKLLHFYTLNRGTCVLHRGTFVPNFENAVTKFVNRILPANRKITNGECRKKLMELRRRYLFFMHLNDGEEPGEADFIVPREYEMYKMFKTVWLEDLAGSALGSGADKDSCPNQGLNAGTAVQGAGANFINLDLNADMCNLEGSEVNVDATESGTDEGQVNVANMEVESGQENVKKMEVDGIGFLFDKSENEAQDDCNTLKLLVHLKSKRGISLPKHVNKGRFLKSQRKLKTKYEIFVKEYGKKPLNSHAFSSKFGYIMYRMSRFIWGDHVIESDGSSTSTDVDGVHDPDDYKDIFDPNADYDPKKDIDAKRFDDSWPNQGVDVDPDGPGDSIVDVDRSGSYHDPDEELEHDDPMFVDADDPDDPTFHRVKACFGSELDSTPAPVIQVLAAGKKLIFKAPRPQDVKVKSGRDIELIEIEADTTHLEEVGEDINAAHLALAIEISLGKVSEDGKKRDQPAPKINTLALKARKINTLSEAIDNKQPKRRKLLDSPPKNDEDEEEEEEEDRKASCV